MSRRRFLSLLILVWWLPILLGALSPAAALPSQSQLYLSVGQAEETPLAPEAEHAQCAALQQVIRRATDVGYATRCGALPLDPAEISTAQAAGQYRYHIALVRGVSHTARLSIENWRPRHEGDFEHAQWMICGDSEEALQTALQGLLSTFFRHDADPRTLPESLLLHGAQEVKLMSLKAGTLEVDEDNLAQHAFEVDWQRYQDELTRPRHFLRTSAEIVLLIGLGTANYWQDKPENQADFDLPPKLSSLGKKLSGEAVRLDNNKFLTNTFNHAFISGAGYYTVARSTGYGPFGSFLFSLAGSSVWEYLTEYLEFVSINDQIFTPIGGTVIGEVMFQLGEFFTTSADTPTNGALKWVFGTIPNLHRWLDDIPATRAATTDRFGLRNDIWHRFDLLAGGGVAGDTPIGEIRLKTQLIHLPGYGRRRGDISSWINSTLFTQMQVRSSFSADGLQDLTIFFKAMFLGYFRQHLTGPRDGPLSGYSLFIGLASAYELNTHEWSDTGIEDTYGVINLLGPSMDLTSYQGDLRLRMTMALYGDFAAIRAFAVDAFKQVGSLEGAKSVLRNRDYYFGLGLTARVQGTLQYDRLEVGMHGRYSYYDSIEGLDIDEETVTNDVETTDTIASVGTWITYEVMRAIIHVGFSYERRWRSGTAADGSVRARESETEDRFLGFLRFSF